MEILVGTAKRQTEVKRCLTRARTVDRTDQTKQMEDGNSGRVTDSLTGAVIPVWVFAGDVCVCLCPTRVYVCFSWFTF